MNVKWTYAPHAPSMVKADAKDDSRTLYLECSYGWKISGINVITMVNKFKIHIDEEMEKAES